MGKILIIDDTQFWRDTAGDILRARGHTVTTAVDGMDGLTVLRASGADLIILDVEMPRLAGLSFLDQIRQNSRWKNIPVIMLTGDMLKDDVLRAKKLGAVDYLLKSRFDTAALLDRVQKRLGSAESDSPTRHPAVSHSAPGSAAPARNISKPASGGETAGPMLSRQQSLDRVEMAMKGKVLSGVVTQVVALSQSKDMNLADLASLISRDPVLAARVLQTANSAGYASHRGMISSISDAVRIIGSATVRDIAASVGIFEMMPQADADGFNPIQCWQHSLATAILCSLLAPKEHAGVAYLIGLCHNLGEILFRSHFGAEYRQILEEQATTHKPRRELEKSLLGITRGELVGKILKQMELPAPIRDPIIAYHQDDQLKAIVSEPLARVLLLADVYANAVLLTSADEPVLRPLTRIECRKATGQDDPPLPVVAKLRSEILAMTSTYARLSPSQENELIHSVPKRRAIRIWLARDSTLSSFDPIALALDGFAEVTSHDSLPIRSDLAEFQGLFVLARTAAIVGFASNKITEAATRADGSMLPIFWLTAPKNDSLPQISDNLPASSWPISVNALGAFVQKIAEEK